MAKRAMITPLTMYNLDNTLFDGITLPIYNFPRSTEYPDLFLNGWSMDKDTFINNLLLETAELNTIYTDPDYFKYAITQWSHKEFPIWQKLYETLFYKYNPIWNKDGTTKRNADEVRNLFGTNIVNKSSNNGNTTTENESINDIDNTNNIYSERENANKTNNNKNTETENEVTIGQHNKTGSNDTTTTNSVSAFDSATYAGRDQTVADNDTTERNNDNNTKTNIKTSDNGGSENNNNNRNGEDITVKNYNRGRTNTNTTSGNNNENENGFSTDTGNIANNEIIKEFGNIGLLTTQAMIEAERNLVKFNIYDFIIDSFKARFCLLIY